MTSPWLRFPRSTLIIVILAWGMLTHAGYATLIAKARERTARLETKDSNPERSAGLFVGVGEFRGNSGLPTLSYSTDDAVALAHLFVVELVLIPPQHAWLALGGKPTSQRAQQMLARLETNGVRLVQASRHEIFDAVREVSRLVTDPSGLLVMTFSTHGYEVGGTLYLMPSDGLLSDVDFTGVPLPYVSNQLRRTQTSKRIMIIDTCRLSEVSSSRGSEAKSPALDAALRTAKGHVLLQSCAVAERSWEDKKLQQGVFTHFLLEALRGKVPGEPKTGFIRLGAVARYASTNTQAWVQREHSAQQTPCFDDQGGGEDIPLALDPQQIRHAEDLAKQRHEAKQTLRPVWIRFPNIMSPAFLEEVEKALDSVPDGDALKRLLDRCNRFKTEYQAETVEAFITFWNRWRKDTATAAPGRAAVGPAAAPLISVQDAIKAREQRAIQEGIEQVIRNPTPPFLPPAVEPTFEGVAKAQQEFSRGEYKGAMVLLSKLSSPAADGTAAWLLRARTSAKLGQYRQAIQDCTRVLEHSPRCPEALLLRARVHFEIFERDKAIPNFGLLSGTNALFADATALQLIHFPTCDHWSDLPRTLETLTRSAATNALACVALGAAAAANKDWTTARRHYDAALRLDPREDLATQLRVAASDNGASPSQLREAVDLALSTDPQCMAVLLHAGVVQGRLGDTDGLQRNLSQAIALNPDALEVGILRALVRFLNEDLEEVANQCSALLPTAGNHPAPLLLRGLARLHLQDYERAVSDFSAAIAILPCSSDSFKSRALAYANLNQSEPAMQDITRAIILDDTDAQAYVIRAHLYPQDFGGLQKSTRDLKKAFEINPRLRFNPSELFPALKPALLESPTLHFPVWNDQETDDE